MIWSSLLQSVFWLTQNSWLSRRSASNPLTENSKGSLQCRQTGWWLPLECYKTFGTKCSTVSVHDRTCWGVQSSGLISCSALTAWAISLGNEALTKPTQITSCSTYCLKVWQCPCWMDLWQADVSIEDLGTSLLPKGALCTSPTSANWPFGSGTEKIGVPTEEGGGGDVPVALLWSQPVVDSLHSSTAAFALRLLTLHPNLCLTV